jgi:hypothetical protein
MDTAQPPEPAQGANVAAAPLSPIVQPAAPEKTLRWTRNHTFGLFFTIIGILVANLLVPRPPALFAWGTTFVLLATSVAIAGNGIVGRWMGALIDDRNRISLSRLQMSLWTILVLSAFLTAALANIATGQANPLAIAIPSQLWLVMGITTTALVGSPLIKSYKAGQPVSADVAVQTSQQKTLDLLAKQRSDMTDADNHGRLIVLGSPKDASWSDLFQGEEISNAALLDLGKVQMFYFTLILLLAYGAALATLFSHGPGGITQFPVLDESMITLFGISNGGYLVNKAIPHN